MLLLCLRSLNVHFTIVIQIVQCPCVNAYAHVCLIKGNGESSILCDDCLGSELVFMSVQYKRGLLTPKIKVLSILYWKMNLSELSVRTIELCSLVETTIDYHSCSILSEDHPCCMYMVVKL